MEEKFKVLKQEMWLCSDSAEPDALEDFAEEQYENLKDDIAAVAALVTVLNHKSWYWFRNSDEELSYLYSDLYYKYNEKAWNWLEANGTEEEKSWYFHTMD